MKGVFWRLEIVVFYAWMYALPWKIVVRYLVKVFFSVQPPFPYFLTKTAYRQSPFLFLKIFSQRIRQHIFQIRISGPLNLFYLNFVVASDIL